MLKETLISIFSVILIIVGDTVTRGYADKALSNITEGLTNLREVIATEEVNYEEATNKMENVYSNWEEKYDKLAYFIEHDELEKVEDGLTQIRSNIEMEENQEAVVQLDSTTYILSHIEDKLAIELENIF